MSISRGFYWLFAFSFLVLVLILSWSGRILYQSEIKHIREDLDNIVRKEADSLQNANLTLNNLANAYTDSERQSKIAFAIGMTQNLGKLNISFGDNVGETNPDTIAHKDTVPVFDKKLVQKEHVQFIPSAVKTISYFDSVFKIQLKRENLIVPYNIQKVAPHQLPKSANSSGLFILNFFEPTVYRVVYNIPIDLVIRRLLPFISVGILLLVLVWAAFILYHKSYCLQVQMAQFKDSLLSNFTHELKTPVASMQLFIDLLKNDGGKTEIVKHDEYINLAETELNRMKLLIEKILSFGKLSEEQFELDREVLHIEDIINEAIVVMKVSATGRGAEIDFDNEGSAEIMGDRLLLINLLTVIIDNALKYNTGKPIIHIGLLQGNDEIKILIKDNGIGIAKTYHHKIFEPFFRVPAGDIHDVKGHGLGLSFVQQAVKLHKGSIFIESEKGQGTTFIICLPTL